MATTIYNVFISETGRHHFNPDVVYIGTYDSKDKAINAILAGMHTLDFNKNSITGNLTKDGSFELGNMFYEIIERQMNASN